MKQNQGVVEKAVMNVINLRPSRPVRDAMGLVLALLFSKGDTRGLVDCVTALHGHARQLIPKGAKEAKDLVQIKLCALRCLGHLTGKLGRMVRLNLCC